MRMLTEYDEDKVRALWEGYGEEKGRVEGKEETSKEVLALIKQGFSLEEIEKILTERLAAQT
jgi:SOS response regulatory protein OraA/RecX